VVLRSRSAISSALRWARSSCGFRAEPPGYAAVVEEHEDELVRREEEAAGAEAGSIGGRAPADADPAQEPVAQAGGGQGEGFEEAERELTEHAEHTTGEGIPRPTQMGEEAEVDRAAYGEADRPRPQP